VEASDGLPLAVGQVVLAKGGVNLRVERHAGSLIARLASPTAGSSLYVPSVNLLFQSAARACGARTLALVLTGMGNDGLEGARAVVAAGGAVLTEAESTSVIYGMPRCVREEGLAVEEAPLDELVPALLRRLT
jgi:two-component system chemotaxis response regulator CheB